MVFSVTEGNIFGYATLVLVCISAVLMYARGPLLKKFKKLNLIRQLHIAVSSAAGVFLILHVISFITFPASIGLYVGYASFATIFVVWLTGTAFLERVRDSLIFHGSLSLAAITLALIHASTLAVMPALFAYATLVCTSSVAAANAAYHFHKMKRT